MSMKALAQAGDKADKFIKFGKSFSVFINTNTEDITEIRQAFGKPLNTVTDADIEEYFGMPMQADALISAKAFLVGMQDIIDVVVGIKNKLPANDLRA